jgi:catechol 2,3-dioxygenase-like lactoylglutathione lyase family enzyme
MNKTFGMKLYYFLLLCIILNISCKTKEPVSPRFNHVVIQVSDMNKSVKFYTDAFDLVVTNDSLKHVVYTLADGTKKEREVNIVLLKFPNQDFVYEMVEVSDYDHSTNFDKFHHIGIDVRDIKLAFERAIRAGAEVLVPIQLVQTNGIETKQAFLNGPDGEIIELMQLISGNF